MTTLLGLALALAIDNGAIAKGEAEEITGALRRLPAVMASALASVEADIQAAAHDIIDAVHMLYIARGRLYPLALEGALKMKEISYIHAEGYAAGEFKHGPIALIDDHMPVVVLAPSNDPLFEKTASNLEESVARGAQILLISDAAGVEKMKKFARWTVTMPDVHPVVAPILYALPIQLLAYHVAVAKGTDVDQPRNLAKSVTVE